MGNHRLVLPRPRAPRGAWIGSRRAAFGVALVLSWCTTRPGGAEETAEAARAHFARAIALMDQGAPAQAIEEFERAYRARPHFAVLYNIGLAHAALDRPVAAVRALERYLEEGGEQVPAERRAAVDRELARQRARTAAITITTDPPAAAVAVDGEALSADRADAPVRVTVGTHRIQAVLAGHRTAVVELSLAAGEERSFHVVLAADPGAPPALGQLPVDCPIPGVALVVDGREVDRTPLGAPLLVTAGAHEVTCRRDGYDSLTREVQVPAAGVAPLLRCRLPVSRALRPEGAAELTVEPSESDATVLIDSERAPATSR
ncbi:MAG TPA: PEGA domain-containing protein, partial [Polyangiaceae bacterium]|nr:PEGA domain-containing protein [Polyangiaceae bacterium]